MKKIIKELMYLFLSGFSFFRKKLGGTWYQVYDERGASGLAAGRMYWIQRKPNETEDIAIEKIEQY